MENAVLKSKLGNNQKLKIKSASTNEAITVPLNVKKKKELNNETTFGTYNNILEYQLDWMQRSILYLDTLRERANNILEHEQSGLPPVLDFEYETILDAREFDKSVNYALLLITVSGDDCLEDCIKESARPVIVFDPRAGHGPGIGGFKRESEVGIALHEGHPVYFVSFFPEPCPEQTLEDVLHALRSFVEEVIKRHPDTPSPVMYGNCQAGWSVVLLSADCEGMAGSAILNGSPLSYWSGEDDVNPMRLAGGLLGGAWLTHLLADLGGGRFDGAWLAQNFESLNPANTLWDKNYNLFSKIDSERERFIEFERWWNGFYFLNKSEITSIAENLFIGNKPERGEMKVCGDCYVDLKRIRNPLLIFASSGDNITPPHQALNWIPAVYPNTKALKDAGQRIVYLIDPHVGHLGIFVSAKVARFEHRAILENVDKLESLEPGLYQMRIDNPTGNPDCNKSQYTVTFEERKVEDIHYKSNPEAFKKVKQISEFNTALYETFVGPWIRSMVTPWSAEHLKLMHPMRISRYFYSERFNPLMLGVSATASHVMENRQPSYENNPYISIEQQVSRSISESLDGYRKLRDTTYQQMFNWIYG
jgi:pimeloyl-ACP methyl ester carboxylesterase